MHLCPSFTLFLNDENAKIQRKNILKRPIEWKIQVSKLYGSPQSHCTISTSCKTHSGSLVGLVVTNSHACYLFEGAG